MVYREFVVSVGKHLEELASTEKPRTPKVASKVVSTISDNAEQPKTMGPLKSSRDKGDQPSRNTSSGSGSQAGSSRLLQSALQSSRDGVPAAPSRSRNGAQQDSRDVGHKRGSNDNNNSGNKRSRDQGRGGDDNRGRGGDDSRGGSNRRSVTLERPPQPTHAANNAPAHGTVEYFEQMNKVAQASGFRNAQEMIASQKEMMAMMQQQTATAGMPAAPMMPPMHAGFPATAGDESFQPPYPGGPPPQQWGQGRGGRGYGRGAWAGGRGRGGRGPPPPVDGSAVMETGVAPAAAEAGGEDQAPAATGEQGEGGYAGGYQGGRGYQGRGYQGRGRGRGEWAPAGYAPSGGYYPTSGRGGRSYGRGGGGRFYPTSAAAAGEAPAASTEGAPTAPGAAPHKTWVRQADMNSSLVTGR